MIAQGVQHGVTYFKRFRMEVDLQGALPPMPELPEGCFWVPWESRLLDRHAEVKYECFLGEVDSVVFVSLSSREGCRRLMHEIVAKPGFKREATWLVADSDGYCATIQGVRERSGMGAIQNVGVIPAWRGRGLGTALVLKALHGFHACGAHRANLEVTAQNEAAIRIYRRLGFRFRKTIYKAVEVVHEPGAFAALD